ncbi:MAG: imelysin family protein, partial [Pseudomonadota bacterium]
GLEFLHDQRLGRPLGSFERPKPRQAEARRSGRSLRNITLALTSLREMTEALAGENAPGTLAAFDKAIAHAEALDDPALQGVADPAKRLKVEVLQRMVRDIQVEVIEEIGRGLGVTAGFNALDGD